MPIGHIENIDPSEDPRVTVEKAAHGEVMLARAITDGETPPRDSEGWGQVRMLAVMLQEILVRLGGESYRDPDAAEVVTAWLAEGQRYRPIQEAWRRS